MDIRLLRRSKYPLEFDKFYADKDLRRLRALCIVRTILLKNVVRIKNTPNAENIPLCALLKFPHFALSVLSDQDGNCLRVQSSMIEHFRNLHSEISRSIPAIYKYIYSGEPNPLWVGSLFNLPEFSCMIELEDFYHEFYRNINLYPYKIYINCMPNPKLLYNDFYLVFELYKKFKVELPEFYRGTLQIENQTDTACRYETDALRFLKCSLNKKCSYRVAIIDMQNMIAGNVFTFFKWVYKENPDAFAKVIFIGDGSEPTFWSFAEKVVRFPLDFVTCERVLERKSTVDTLVVAHAVKEFYEFSAEELYIFSGDCDFLPLTDVLPSVRFCFCSTSSAVYEVVDLHQEKEER